MRTTGAKLLVACGLGFLVAACERAEAPPRVAPGPAPAAAAPAGVERFAGASLAEFWAAPEMARYRAAGLGMAPSAQARLTRATTQTAPGWIVEGGGARALAFVGCAAEACAQAAAIMAIDLDTGAAFVAVRDEGGRDVLVANPKLEALVETTTPADRWDDPAAWAEVAREAP